MHTKILNFFKKRYQISSTRLALLLTIFFVFLANNPFWRQFYSSLGAGSNVKYGFLFSFSASLFLLTFLIFNIFSLGLFGRILTIIVLLISSIVLYFMNTYGVVIDKSMIQNAIETDTIETLDLINFNLFFYFLIYGFLPVCILSKLIITKQSLFKEIKLRVWQLLITLLLIIILAFPFAKNYTLLSRNHRELRYLFNPFNYIYSTSSLVAKSLKTKNRSLISISNDSKLKNAVNPRKKVLILVIGETARAKNFSLNGYERDTNPLLKTKKIINFTNAYSCGTSTSVSLPCIFSHLGKNNGADEKKVKLYENLLDLLGNVGIPILWKENNSGCKGICNRVETETIKFDKNNSLCEDNKCQDELLLNGLTQRIESTSKDSLIILHTQGSHGPAYYKRYPKEFKKYNPTCDTAQIEDCTKQSVINTYDNTILYTDYLLSKIIDLLEVQSKNYDTGMIYVSDHGESLGENNIYLHGSPYYMAPDNQIHVPLIMWISNALESSLKINYQCLTNLSSEKHSHDNIFHTILGIYDIDSSHYRKELDILKQCLKK